MEDRPNNTAGGTGGSVVDQARDKAQDLGQQAKEKAGQMAGQVGDQIKSQLSTQKEQVAGGIGTVAEALRMTGQQLKDQNQAPVAGYANQAADMVDGISGYLREHEVDDIVREVEGFARRQPAVFLGAAFTLGFMAARFLKSSSTPSYPSEQDLQRSGGRMHDAMYEQPHYETPGYSAAQHGYGTSGTYGTQGSYGAQGSYGTQGSYGAPSYGTQGSTTGGTAASYTPAPELTLSGEGRRDIPPSTTHYAATTTTAIDTDDSDDVVDTVDTDTTYSGTGGARTTNEL